MAERKILRIRPVLRRALAIAGAAVMRVEQPAGEVTPEHSHDLLELAFLERGTQVQQVDGRELALRPGCLLVMPLGCRHGYRVGAGGSLLWNLLIDREHLPRPFLPAAQARRLERLLAPPGSPPFLLADVALAAPLAGFHREQERTEPGWVQAAAAQLALAAVAMVRALDAQEAGPALAGDRRLDALCQAIEAEPGRDWSLAELGRRSGLERGALIRAFTAATGSPPARFVRQARLRQARALIQGGAGLAQAAAASGYGSAAALAHAARRATGGTPASWRGRAIKSRGAARNA